MTREEASFILANIDRRVCDDELSEALDMAIKALEQEPKWIPVSDDEPFLYNPKTAKEAHKGIDFLTLLSNGKVAITKRKFYISGQKGDRFFGKWAWSTRGRTKVLAWMPLPKPYEPQESEE